MKRKNLFQTLVISASLFGMMGCSNKKTSSSVSSNSNTNTIVDSNQTDDTNNANTTTVDTNTNNTCTCDTSNNNSNNSNSLIVDGVQLLSKEPSDDVVNDIIDSLISKGGSVIADGITTYSKSVVINLLKECGFDFRDATTKTLEKIQEQLKVIENKLDAMTKKQSQQHAETVLGPLLKQVNDTQNDYLTYVVDGLGYLAELENDTTLDETDIEASRKEYYNNTIKDLTIDGKPIATYVSNLADYIMLPNNADRSKSIFDYYEETLGVYDVWSTLKLRNMRNFMAYIDSVLVSIANLAKFQIYYKSEGMDTATLKTYESMINTMATKVNEVNALFKSKLEALQELEDKKNNGINIYMSTGKEYSTRMATLTFDTTDEIDGDTRQALLMDVYSNRDGSRGDSYKYVLEYVPDQSFVQQVADDFKTYAGAFCSSTYTIKDYLKYAGFTANNEELFDKAVGLYNAGLYADGHGFMQQDYEYTSSYYDEKGEYTRKAIYEVDSYHNWLQQVTRTVFTQYDYNFYLCFTTPSGDRQALDGIYQRTYIQDAQSTINKQLHNSYYLYDAFENNRNNAWYVHDSW